MSFRSIDYRFSRVYLLRFSKGQLRPRDIDLNNNNIGRRVHDDQRCFFWCLLRDDWFWLIISVSYIVKHFDTVMTCMLVLWSRFQKKSWVCCNIYFWNISYNALRQVWDFSWCDTWIELNFAVSTMIVFKF